MRNVCFLCVLGVLFAPTADVTAQDHRSQALDEEARSLFEAGSTAWGSGRYEAALDYFQRAYGLSHRTELLFNIGQAAERSRQDRTALEAFRQFVAETPEGSQRSIAETRVAFLMQQLEEADEPDPPVDTDAAEPASLSRVSSSDASDDSVALDATAASNGESAGPVPWIFVAIGAAAAVAGGVLLGLGLADQAAVEDPPAGARWADTVDAYERSPTLLVSGGTLLPVGVVTMVVGIIWAVAGSGGGESDAVLLRPGGNNLDMVVRF